MYKRIQSIFLIVGTAIGAGILALPTATAASGFLGATIALVVTWLFMTYAAFNMLRARLCLKGDVDLSSMTTHLLGPRFNWLVEAMFLALLMALVALYITVGSDWIMKIALDYGYASFSPRTIQWTFTGAIVAIIFSGLANVAQINQVITALKVFFLFMIIFTALPEIHTSNLYTAQISAIPHSLSMLITTFGFSVVLPSLAGYLSHERRHLMGVLSIASIIILLAYFGWNAVAFGIIGAPGLNEIAQGADKGTGVIRALGTLVQNPHFQQYGFGIMVTAVLTSFLGVGHALFSYMKDALPGRKNTIKKAALAITLGFFPPLLLVTFLPTGIAEILRFAGVFVAFILGIVPTLMVRSKAYESARGPLPSLDRIATTISLLFFVGIILQEIWSIIQ